MSYIIRPIEFEKEVPSIKTISKYIEAKSSQNIIVSEGDFDNHYSAKLVNFPDDVLQFEVKENIIYISGDSYDAPALCELLYTALVQLGGKQSPHIQLLELPISDKEIKDLNSKARKNINLFSLTIWLFILVGIVLICGVTYALFSWLL